MEATTYGTGTGVGAPRDVPVALDLHAGWGTEVRTWIEQDLGWQVVHPTGALPPVGRVTDDPGTAVDAVLLLPPGMPDGEREAEVRRAFRGGARDVVAWPDERDRIVGALLRARPRERGAARTRRRLGVAGLHGGAGATTVALALAGLAAWRGARVLALGDDDLSGLAGLGPWAGPGLTDLAVLGPADAGREAATLALAVPGVAGLSVLGAGGATAVPSVVGHRDHPGGASGSAEADGMAGGAAHGGWSLPSTDVTGWPFDLVVVDLGRATTTADVVVTRPTRSLTGALPPGRLIVRSSDRTTRRTIRRMLGSRPYGLVGEDVRVHRAGFAGRVPSALPGRWLADLSAAVGTAGGSR